LAPETPTGLFWLFRDSSQSGILGGTGTSGKSKSVYFAAFRKAFPAGQRKQKRLITFA
jgi:hypothetical protein